MKVALYARVSTDEQTEQNQVPILEKWAAQRNFEVTGIYTDSGSAWQKADQKQLRKLQSDAHRGLFQCVLVWDLDRLTRGGIARFFSIVDGLRQCGVRVLSYRQSWTDTPSELQPLLFSVFAFFAEQESKKISDRTKAGMARAKAQGIHVGRPRKTDEQKLAQKRKEELARQHLSIDKKLERLENMLEEIKKEKVILES